MNCYNEKTAFTPVSIREKYPFNPGDTFLNSNDNLYTIIIKYPNSIVVKAASNGNIYSIKNKYLNTHFNTGKYKDYKEKAKTYNFKIGDTYRNSDNELRKIIKIDFSKKILVENLKGIKYPILYKCLVSRLNEKTYYDYKPAKIMEKKIVKKYVKGMKVVRGPDWGYNDLDTKNGGTGIGTVVKKRGLNYVEVEWEGSNETSTYSIGAWGKYELYQYETPIKKLYPFNVGDSWEITLQNKTYTHTIRRVFKDSFSFFSTRIKTCVDFTKKEAIRNFENGFYKNYKTASLKLVDGVHLEPKYNVGDWVWVSRLNSTVQISFLNSVNYKYRFKDVNINSLEYPIAEIKRLARIEEIEIPEGYKDVITNQVVTKDYYLYNHNYEVSTDTFINDRLPNTGGAVKLPSRGRRIFCGRHLATKQEKAKTTTTVTRRFPSRMSYPVRARELS